MAFSERFIRIFRTLLPAPFTIAVGLTAVTFWLAFLFTRPDDVGTGAYVLTLLEGWESGLWTNGLMVFALQMMLMLVLGHVLALTGPVNRLIEWVVGACTTTPRAAATVTFLTVAVALFNWGLGLIFGAILARKVGEHAARHGWSLNYPLIGAAGYSGLMVWHGGISGSSLTKVAEEGHIREMMASHYTESKLAELPAAIDYLQTVFSSTNLTISLALLVLLPLCMYWLAGKLPATPLNLQPNTLTDALPPKPERGAEQLDHARWPALLFGLIVLATVGYKMFLKPGGTFLGYWNPNNINFLLLGLALVMHGNFYRFLKAVDAAIAGSSGILIQFPLYFGIMGIMTSSGLVHQLSGLFVELSRATAHPATTYPLLTFVSAGLVNIFVPSGGGQWAVQGPIIVQAAQELGVSLPKSIMAMAYGDQLTNMLQPFWALPLLGITGLRAKDILPYTLFLMLLGA
ncbi:MAG: TIGR00366 family protein, partial [Bacteroidota bacterium]